MLKTFNIGVLNRFVNLFKHKKDEPMSGSSIRYLQRPSAGSIVTHENALTLSAVWSCVHIISETIGSLSCHVYEKKSDGGREQKENHLNYVLSVQANPETSALAFRETIVAPQLEGPESREKSDTWGCFFKKECTLLLSTPFPFP